MTSPQFGMLTLGMMCLTTSLLAACVSRPFPPPLSTATPRPATDFALPSPVYFLRGGQVWRLARDGRTQVQITREAAPVESFDLSPLNGALAYVTGNALILADAEGEHRHVLLSGPTLPALESELATLNDRAYITGKIATPKWSPEGSRIAYVQNGLNVITPPDGSVPSGKVQVIHPNDSIPEHGEVTDRLVITSVISWSPDGQHALVMIYRYPLRSIYYQKVALKTFGDYLSTLKECLECTFAWSADGQIFYLANPGIGGSDALSRCTVADVRCTWIGQDVPARTAFFYGYPYVNNSDEVYVFTGTSRDRGSAPETFRLYRVRSDGYGVTQIRADEHSIQTALWAEDGRGVLIVTASASGVTPPDTLLWLSVDGSSAIMLPVVGARSLCWGSQ